MSQHSSSTSLARRHLVFGLAFGIAAMVLGLYMSVSHDYAQRPAHVHMNLVGFVVSVIYAVIYRLWLPGAASGLATVQIWLHQIGALAMVTGLTLLFGNVVPEAKIGPVLGLAALAVIASAILMLVQVVRTPGESRG